MQRGFPEGAQHIRDYGLMNEFPAQRFLHDSCFPMIGGGANDITRPIVARQLCF
jgi:alkylation response protein AidB-like acyl-CoA dehydrogenase